MAGVGVKGRGADGRGNGREEKPEEDYAGGEAGGRRTVRGAGLNRSHWLSLTEDF